jgi:hypothetical protein
VRHASALLLGPTTLYAFMHAMRLVNDHQSGCHVLAAVDAVRLLSPDSVRLLVGPAWTFDGDNGAIGEEDEPAHRPQR